MSDLALKPEPKIKNEQEYEKKIGYAAGKVWQHLSSNGECTLTAIKRSLKATPVAVELGLGWLAREGKLDFDEQGRKTVIRLR